MEVEGWEPWSLSYLGRGRGPDAGDGRVYIELFLQCESDILCVFVLCVAASGLLFQIRTSPTPRPARAIATTNPTRPGSQDSRSSLGERFICEELQIWKSVPVGFVRYKT